MATNNAINQTGVGFHSLTSSGVYNARSIAGTANQITITNGDGTAGNPTASLTSTIQVSGISFDSGTTTLSTFTQGTFSPTFTGSSSNPTPVYTIQVGRYQQVGRNVSIQATCAYSSISGGSGNLRFASLPFTSANNTNDFMACATAVGISQTTPYPVSSSYASNYVQANQTFANCSAVTTGGSVSGYAVSTSAAHFSINVIIEV